MGRVVVPVTRPDGRINYLPHEAYNVVGRRNFGANWQERFANQPTLPDIEYVRRAIERGGPEADRYRPELANGEAEYDRRQAQRRRERRVFDALIEALHSGKTEAYTGDWQIISVEAWKHDAQLFGIFSLDIYLALQTESIVSGISVDKTRLDDWMGSTFSSIDPEEPEFPEPGPIGRPRDDWPWFREELAREIGAWDDFENGWRGRICLKLRRSYIINHPGIEPRRVPKVVTIMRRIKPELDTTEVR
jgi:hypothetical protein